MRKTLIRHHRFDQFAVIDALQVQLGQRADRMGAAQLDDDAFRALRPERSPPYVLARYFLCDPEHGKARATALPFIRDFGANMRRAIQRIPAAQPVQPFHQPATAYDDAALLDNAIVGDPAACVEQCLALREQLGPCVLLLKPAAYEPEANRRALTLFAEQVRPHLPA